MEHELYKILQHGFVELANPPNGKENAAYVLSKVLLLLQFVAHNTVSYFAADAP
jgi:hypothetical protein